MDHNFLKKGDHWGSWVVILKPSHIPKAVLGYLLFGASENPLQLCFSRMHFRNHSRRCSQWPQSMGKPCPPVIKTSLNGKMAKENTICPAPISCRDHHYPPPICPDFPMLVGTPPYPPPPSIYNFICSWSALSLILPSPMTYIVIFSSHSLVLELSLFGIWI